MNRKQKIGTIIRQQRKSIPLTLRQLSKLSGVSIAHLGRIEQGTRQPSTRTLQKIAKHLGFDLYELLVIAHHLLPEPSILPEEERDKLRAELQILVERVETDSKRIKEITDRLSMTS